MKITNKNKDTEKMNIQLIKNRVEEFKNAWQAGMDNLAKACKIYVDAIDEDESAKNEFKAAYPTFSAEAWGRIEATGRNQLYYTLLCDTSPAAEKLRKLPYSEQKKAIEGTVEVLSNDGTFLKVKPENMTQQMIRQVIARDHIRDIPAQKAYIESLKTIREIEREKPKELWSVKGNLLQVHAPSSFNRQQLLKILQEMG